MRLGSPLLKLPVRFCGDTLAREVVALPEAAWMEHPQKYDGNIAVPLVSPGGAQVHQTFGPMAPTEWLKRCRYIVEIMQALDATWGRSRLMGLAAGAVVPEHVDIHYYWRTHLRIHIPVITNPQVGFTAAGETIHMQAGDCYILDSFYRHAVKNAGSETRVHLVLDTVGSAHLWDLIEEAQQKAEPRFVKPGQTEVQSLNFEQINAPAVMSPWEIRTHLAYIADWTDDGPELQEILKILDRFLMAWTGAWAAHGPSEAGLPIYLRLLSDIRPAISKVSNPGFLMRNGRMLCEAVDRFILGNAIAPAIVQKLQRSGAMQPFRMSA